jgi:hypothetical protein
MTGEDKAAAVADKLRKKNDDIKIDHLAERKPYALSESDPEFQKLLQQDAKEEIEKSGGSLPILKVFVTNKSTQTLADGKEPNNGWFFYTPTREQYEMIHCHILKISRGFRMPGMADDKGEVKNKWNHIVSGIILNDEPKPFWLFVSGQARVQRLWSFEKELKEFNNAGMPTFPLIIKLTTEKVANPTKGKSAATVVNFEVEKEDNGIPQSIKTKEEYMNLRQKVHEQEKYINEYIERKEVVENVKPEVIEDVSEVSQEISSLPAITGAEEIAF